MFFFFFSSWAPGTNLISIIYNVLKQIFRYIHRSVAIILLICTEDWDTSHFVGWQLCRSTLKRGFITLLLSPLNALFITCTCMYYFGFQNVQVSMNVGSCIFFSTWRNWMTHLFCVHFHVKFHFDRLLLSCCL